MASITVTEGVTAPILQQLTEDGAAKNLDGMSVRLILRTRLGTLVDVDGLSSSTTSTDKRVSITDSSDGRVRFDPLAGDLSARLGPYTARWRATDTAGKDAYFPSDAPDVWHVESA